MASYLMLFWGFFFVLVDFRIQGFDIIPDVVGYILIIAALSKLASGNRHFSLARNLSIPLLIFSALDFLGSKSAPAFAAGSGSGVGVASYFGLGAAVIILIGIASIVVDLLLVYNVCAGIWETAAASGRGDLAEEARSRWKLYVILAVGGIAFIALLASAIAGAGFRSAGGLIAFAFIFFIFAIIVLIMFLRMLWHAHRILDQGHMGPSAPGALG